MTGPQHYRAAEHYVQHSKDHTDTGNEADRHIAALAAAQAQVHATLALAAAAADPAVWRYLGDESITPREWTQAVS